jgi:hypothetical protein
MFRTLHDGLRHHAQALLRASQRQLIVFLAVYLALFGPLLTGWHFGGEPGFDFPQTTAFADTSGVLCGQPAVAPAILMQCGTQPLHNLPRIFVVPGTFVLALVVIALLIILHSIQSLPLVRLVRPLLLDDPPPRLPPRSL